MRRRPAVLTISLAGALALTLLTAGHGVAGIPCGPVGLGIVDQLTPAFYSSFNDADARSANNQTYVGRKGDAGSDDDLLVRRWNGVKLLKEKVRRPSQGTDAELASVTLLPEGEGWAAGTYWKTNGQSKPVLRHRVGGVWRYVRPPRLEGNASLEGSIDASSPNNVWAVGRERGYKQAVVLRFNGTRWKQLPLPRIAGATKRSAWGVDALSRKNVWIATNFSKGGIEKVAFYRWNGKSFKRMDVEQASGIGNYVNGIAVVDGDEAWAAGSQMMLDGLHDTAFWHWDGNEWSVQSGPSPSAGDNNYIEDITVAGGRLLAVGYYYDLGTKMLLVRSESHGRLLSLSASAGRDGAVLGAGTAEGSRLVVAGGTDAGAPVALANCP
jgi:hypothetical protein